MGDFDHDDGLVHGHSWATEPFRPVAGFSAAAGSSQTDDEYDDGLVHGHDWAKQTVSR